MIIIESAENNQVTYKHDGILHSLDLTLEMVEEATKMAYREFEEVRLPEIKTSVFMFHISNGKRV